MLVSTSATAGSSTRRTRAPASASRSSAAGTARGSPARADSRTPSPVRARLRAIAAYRHRAPDGGAVARAVVEEPVADVASAGLQSRPAAVGDRRVDDPDELGERTVHIAPRRLEDGI